jgi:GT2 family glycosyltransferase
VEVTVAVATYGDSHWTRLALDRAVASVETLGLPWVYVHGRTLHDARNGALAQVATEWVVHLDADDELEGGFAEAMATGTADVRAPAVRYVMPNGRAQNPGMPHVSGHSHPCTADCLTHGNWLVVGSAVRADLVRAVGGWRDFTWSEDWDLWLRCHLAGATFEAVPAAIYRAHVRYDSRNRVARGPERLAAHRAIAAANGVPSP